MDVSPSHYLERSRMLGDEKDEEGGLCFIHCTTTFEFDKLWKDC